MVTINGEILIANYDDNYLSGCLFNEKEMQNKDAF